MCEHGPPTNTKEPVGLRVGISLGTIQLFDIQVTIGAFVLGSEVSQKVAITGFQIGAFPKLDTVDVGFAALVEL